MVDTNQHFTSVEGWFPLASDTWEAMDLLDISTAPYPAP